MNIAAPLHRAANVALGAAFAMAFNSFPGPQVAHAAAASQVSHEVFGFVPYWGLGDHAEFRYDLMTTVGYFAVDLDAGGNAVAGDGGLAAMQTPDFAAMVAAAHAHQNRVVLTIKQFDDAGINSVVSHAAFSQNAINQTLGLVKRFGLDGVAVDFEGTNAFPNERANFVHFMSGLYQQMHAQIPNSEVVVATYAAGASGDGGLYSISALSPYVDAFFVMAYDMATSNENGTAGPNAPLNGWTYNDTNTIQSYLTKTTASKIILGVPTYGYKYCVTAPVPEAPSTCGLMSDPYSVMLADFSCAQQLSIHWDPVAQSPYATWYSPARRDPCGSNLGTWRELYYDNAQSLGLKFDLALQSGIRGVGMWALSYDAGSSDLWNEIALKFTPIQTLSCQCNLAHQFVIGPRAIF